MNEQANEIFPQATRYQAFLLRFWRGDDFGRWRILAKNIQTGEEHHFASLELCVDFLNTIGSDGHTPVNQL